MAVCSSWRVFTAPESVTTPLNVSTSILRPPTAGSFRSAVFTRVVIVASSIVSPTLLPQAPASKGVTSTIASSTLVNLVRVIMQFPPVATAANAMPDPWPMRQFGMEGCRRRQVVSNAHDVEATIHGNYAACDPAACWTKQETRGVAYLGRLDVSAQRRTFAVDLQDLREATDACRGERLDRPRRNRVHPDILRAQLTRQVADARLERRLRHTHHVVVLEDAFAPQVREGEHAAAAPGHHQRRRAARQRD